MCTASEAWLIAKELVGPQHFEAAARDLGPDSAVRQWARSRGVESLLPISRSCVGEPLPPMRVVPVDPRTVRRRVRMLAANAKS